MTTGRINQVASVFSRLNKHATCFDSKWSVDVLQPHWLFYNPLAVFVT